MWLFEVKDMEEIAKLDAIHKYPTRSQFSCHAHKHTHTSYHITFHCDFSPELSGIITIKRNGEGVKLSLVS